MEREGLGLLSYLINVAENTIWKFHTDQIQESTGCRQVETNLSPKTTTVELTEAV